MNAIAMKLGLIQIGATLAMTGCGSSADSPTVYGMATPGTGSRGGSTAPRQDASPALAPMASAPESSSSGGDDAALESGVVEGGSAAAPCVKGQVTPDQVVMIGDSYLDPAWANTSLDLFADAQQAGALAANGTYRHYYLGGASMNGGIFALNIPYQYESQALSDIAVASPKDIDTIIMDGGGNDVLIGNTSCEQTAPPGNTGCVTTIQGAVDRARSLLAEFGANGVKHVVYFFYPHLDPAGGGILTTPAPTVNDTLDYAYGVAAPVCTQSVSPPCVWVDTRPAFEGHLADYIKSDHVHPTPAGAQVIADLVWKAMQDHCIAQ